tara:strand:- start:917 stop:1705 length:789 start_codon:yes stop_codon:yes gene_type:complete
MLVAHTNDSIRESVKKKMVKAYNDYVPTADEMLSIFLESGDGSNCDYQDYSLEDLIEIFGDEQSVLERYSQDVVDVAKKHGAVVITWIGDPTDYDFYAPADAPDKDEFLKEAACRFDWVIDQSIQSLDTIPNEPHTLGLQGAFETLANHLENWRWEEVDGSGTSTYYLLSRDLTPSEKSIAPNFENENGDCLLTLGVRVSSHSKQSKFGHATRGKATVDINIAPSQSGENIYQYADNFDQAHDKIMRATLNDQNEIIFREED